MNEKDRLRLLEKMRKSPLHDDILEAVRDNIARYGMYQIIEYGRHKPYSPKIVEQWLNEIRTIPIRLFLAGEKDWGSIGIKSPNLGLHHEKFEDSPYSVIDMHIAYHRNNPQYDADIVVVNMQRFADLVKHEKGTHGLWAFKTYIYVLHHEVFHSYEREILHRENQKITFINDSRTPKTKDENTYNDLLLKALTEDFMRKNRKFLYKWLSFFPSSPFL